LNDDGLLQGLSGFAAYIPCYENGNCVRAIKKNGQAVIIYRCIKSVISMLLKESGLDLYSLRKNFSGCIGARNLMPVPLRLDTVLIPFKVRKTIGVNDGSFAYIDLLSLKESMRGTVSEFDSAATRGDIAMLAYEIIKLRKDLGK